MDTKDRILDLMKQHEEALKSGQIAELSGIDKKEVDKAIKALIKEEKVFTPKRCFYAPK